MHMAPRLPHICNNSFLKRAPFPPPQISLSFSAEASACLLLPQLLISAPGGSALSTWLLLFWGTWSLHVLIEPSSVEEGAPVQQAFPSRKPQSGQETQFLGKEATLLPLGPATTMAHGLFLRCAVREVGCGWMKGHKEILPFSVAFLLVPFDCSKPSPSSRVLMRLSLWQDFQCFQRGTV